MYSCQVMRDKNENHLHAQLNIPSFYVHADEIIVPLDMKLGYWETTTEIGENVMIKQVLANMPESQRAQMRAMMESEMKPHVLKHCITKDSFKDMDKQLREAFSGQQQCKFKVIKVQEKCLCLDSIV